MELININSIIFPDQSPNSILNGYKEGSMPKEYTGGLEGKGVENLKKFVEDGGTLVFLNRSSDFAIEQFDLPVKNIAKDWEQKDFLYSGFDSADGTRHFSSNRQRNATKNQSRGLNARLFLK